MSRKRLSKLIENAYATNAFKWWRYALFRSRRREDADEIVQDALLRTLRAGPQLETENEVSRYVWTVIRSTSVRTVLATRSRPKTEPFAEDLAPQKSDAGNYSPLDLLLLSEEQEEWEKMLRLADRHVKKLPQPILGCLERSLLRHPQMTYREIAEELGIGKSTVGERVNKGLDLLAKAVLDDLNRDK